MQGVDKQSVSIDHMPVVARSAQALSECELVSEIILVCPAEKVGEYYRLVREFELERVSKVIGGGGSRQQSVFAGVQACDKQAKYYLIHDGARPLITPENVRACILAAFEHGAAAVGVKPKDTLKLVGKDGYISKTIDRAEMISIQTPQVFKADVYARAAKVALCEERDYSDDCQLVERLGERVFIVPGEYENIKITTPADLAVAQALLQLRHQGVEQWLEGG